jgi:hypothetical protein
MGPQILSFQAKARKLNKVISVMQCIHFPCTHAAWKVTAIALLKKMFKMLTILFHTALSMSQ